MEAKILSTAQPQSQAFTFSISLLLPKPLSLTERCGLPRDGLNILWSWSCYVILYFRSRFQKWALSAHWNSSDISFRHSSQTLDSLASWCFSLCPQGTGFYPWVISINFNGVASPLTILCWEKAFGRSLVSSGPQSMVASSSVSAVARDVSSWNGCGFSTCLQRLTCFYSRQKTYFSF